MKLPSIKIIIAGQYYNGIIEDIQKRIELKFQEKIK
jgi:hypothetical protein